MHINYILIKNEIPDINITLNLKKIYKNVDKYNF